MDNIANAIVEAERLARLAYLKVWAEAYVEEAVNEWRKLPLAYNDDGRDAPWREEMDRAWRLAGVADRAFWRAWWAATPLARSGALDLGEKEGAGNCNHPYKWVWWAAYQTLVYAASLEEEVR